VSLAPKVAPPAVPALAVGPRGAVLLAPDGQLAELDLEGAAAVASQSALMVCHTRTIARRLGLQRIRAYDLLELHVFLRPAAPLVPTPRGLADALGLDPPRDHVGEAALLQEAAAVMLQRLADGAAREDPTTAMTAASMARAGWPWGPAVLAALGQADAKTGGLDVWRRLPEFEEGPPPAPPKDAPVDPDAARSRLARLVGRDAEVRTAQSDYAAMAARAFDPRETAGAPRLVLAEAGTGVGKTLGYIAPASLWAEASGGSVWISTYTKNLQRQVDQELDRLFPTRAEKARKVVIRKGRENYLCLLNFEEAVGRAALDPNATVALGLIARWLRATRDGDMVGGDFPSWLTGALGFDGPLGLTDRRGECIYSACAHYRRCFIERSRRASVDAEIVIANHALTMIRATQVEEGELPMRYVFDEGHHLFDAADSAFAAELTGSEASELRRWIRGVEGGGARAGRTRGLKARIGELFEDDDEAKTALEQAIEAAGQLPGEGWAQRLREGTGRGATEVFLGHIRAQVLARADERDLGYDLECGTAEPAPALLDAGRRLGEALEALRRPLATLVAAIAKRLDEDAAELDGATRNRLDAARRGIERRGEELRAWRSMLGDLGQAMPEAFVDWFGLRRESGRERDVGYFRHWLDPTRPFAQAVLAPAHGAVVTSATLRDRDPAAPEDWQAAELRTGAHHLPLPAQRASFPSPFDYAARTRVFVVTDIPRDSPEQVATAYRELFLAAGGGALGLFTAIGRLRGVHKRLLEPLDRAGLRLYAQHVDPLDAGTLVDIFRAEEDACLLGTDALRDGVDVPGRSLRLIVFDRVPWPRPDILHAARRKAFGGAAYDDRITRLRLSQAFGRLIRRASDAGVFVILDSRLPSRLLGAFPPGAAVARVDLKTAIAETRAFLAATLGDPASA